MQTIYGWVLITQSLSRTIFILNTKIQDKTNYLQKPFKENYNLELQNVATDSERNIFVLCYFKNVIHLDSLYLKSRGINDILLTKLDSLGNILWTKQLGGISDDIAKKVIVDKQNNIYITGSFIHKAQPDLSNEVSELNEKDISFSEFFVLKLNEKGEKIWFKKGIDKHIFANISDIVLDEYENLYILINYSNIAKFDYIPLDPKNQEGFSILKLNAEGKIIWDRQILGNFAGEEAKIKLDKYNNCLKLLITYRNHLKIDENIFVAKGESDILLSGISTDGRWLNLILSHIFIIH